MLCPEGLKGTIKSHVDEAGAATRLHARLDDASKKQLGKIAIPGGKLLDAVSDWTASAEKLGALEHDKSALLRQADALEGRQPQDAIAARKKASAGRSGAIGDGDGDGNGNGSEAAAPTQTQTKEPSEDDG